MTDMYALAGKTAIVTGGGKGLGKTLARFLLEAEMNVAICGRTETAVKQTVEQLDALFPGNVMAKFVMYRKALMLPVLLERS